MSWRLEITRNHDGDWSKDLIVEKAVGQRQSDSGAGMGWRDMGFHFATKREAEEPRKRVEAGCNFRIITRIWNTNDG